MISKLSKNPTKKQIQIQKVYKVGQQIKFTQMKDDYQKLITDIRKYNNAKKILRKQSRTYKKLKGMKNTHQRQIRQINVDGRVYKVGFFQDGLKGGMINNGQMIDENAQNLGDPNLNDNAAYRLQQIPSDMIDQLRKMLQKIKLAPQIQQPAINLNLLQRQIQINVNEQQKNGSMNNEMVIEKQIQPKAFKTKLDQMMYYIKIGDEASLKASNQQLVYVLGKTGSGKSTLIHFLSKIIAYDISERNQDNQSQSHIPKIQFQRILEHFKIADDQNQNSVTKRIYICQIQSFKICDTAGFNDTFGQIFNLANAVSLRKSFHNSKSIKFIFLIHQSSIISDQKGTTLKKLVQQILGCMNDISLQDFLSSMTVLITHITFRVEDIIQRLKRIIESQKKQISIDNPTQRQNVMRFIKAMLIGGEIQKNQQLLEKLQNDLNNVKIQTNRLDQIIDYQGLNYKINKIKDANSYINYLNQSIKKLQKEQKVNKQGQLQKLAKLARLKGQLKKQEDQEKNLQNSLQQKRKPIQKELQEIQQNKMKQFKLQSQIKKLKSQILNYKSDSDNLLHHLMIFKLKKLLNPQYAQKLINIVKQSKCISQPKTKTKVSIKNNNQKQLKIVINEITSQIDNIINQKRYQQLSQKYNQLCLLNNNFNEISIVTIAKKICMNKIQKEIKKIQKQFEDQVTLLIQNHNYALQLENFKQIRKYFQIMRKIQSLVSLISRETHNTLPNSQSFQKYFCKKYQDWSQRVLSMIKKQANAFNCKKIIEKLKIVHKNFSYELKPIQNAFKKFVQQIFKSINGTIEKIVQKIGQNKLNDCSSSLTFLSILKDSLDSHFKTNLSQKYRLIVNCINQSLKYYSQQKINKIFQLKEIDSQNIQKIKKYLSYFYKLRQNKELNTHINHLQLSDYIKTAEQKIEQQVKNIITNISNLISRGKFKEIKAQFKILKQLRKVSTIIQNCTVRSYLEFVTKLKNQIVNSIKTNIDTIVDKIKSANLTEQEVESVTGDVAKLDDLKWVQEQIPEIKIIEIKEEFENILQKKSKQQQQKLEKLFKSQLRQCENNPKKNLMYQTSQSVDGSVHQRQFYYPDQSQKYFEKLNCSLNFIKKASQISQKIKQIYTDSITKIDTLINNEIEFIQSSVSEDIINKHQMHRIRIDEKLNRLYYLGIIQSNKQQDIDKLIISLCQKIKHYLQNCTENILSKQLTDFQTIQKCFRSQNNLQKSLNNCVKPLENKLKIDPNLKTKLLNSLTSKFKQLYKNTQTEIQNSQTSKYEQNINLYTKYIYISQINGFMSGKIQLDFRNLQSLNNIHLKQLPQQIENYIKSEQYVSIQQILQTNGQNKKIKNMIQNKILLKILQIFETIKNLLLQLGQQQNFQSISNQQFQKLTRLALQIDKLKKIQQIPSITQRLDYKQKKQQILLLIRQMSVSRKDIIQKNIFNFKLNNINNNIKFYKKLLELFKKNGGENLNVINNQPIEQQIDLKQQLQKKINLIMAQQYNSSIKSYQQNIQNLNCYDQQYRTNYEQNYKNQHKIHIQRQIKDISQKLQNIKTVQQAEELQKIFNQLQFSINQILLEHFPVIKKNLSNLKSSIQKWINHFTDSNAQISISRLNKLKKQNLDQYLQKIKQINQTIISCISTARVNLQEQNYKQFQSSIDSIKSAKQKYLTVIDSELIKRIDKSVANFKKQIQKTLPTLSLSLIGKISPQSLINPANLKSVKKYLSIIKYVSFCSQSPIQKDDYKINEQIATYLDQNIIKLDQNNQKICLKQLYDRMKSIQHNENFINILKQFVDGQQQYKYIDKKQTINNFKRIIQKIQQPSELQKMLNQNIKLKFDKIRQYWNGKKFKQIVEILNDLNNVQLQVSKQHFQKGCKSVRQLIKNLSNQIECLISQKKFQQINKEISSIKKAQNQLRNVPGFITVQTQQKKLLKFTQQKIQKDILKHIRQKITEQKCSQIVQYILQLHQWQSNVTFLNANGFIDKQIKKILQQAKRNSLIGTIRIQLQKKYEDRNFPNAGTCGQIMSNYAKQLQIPQIFPLLSQTSEQAIKQFKCDNKQNPINEKQLQFVYQTIFNQKYKDNKKKFIAESMKSRIPDNLQQIKNMIFEGIQQLKISKDYIKYQISILLAHIFTYISIEKSGEQFYSRFQNQKINDNDMQSNLLQPHPIQVLSILRFLGCDQQYDLLEVDTQNHSQNVVVKLDKLKNHLMQIKTGQGKSIILGVMSLLLALLGHNVQCVCYSHPLSQRDHQYFKKIFEEFGVSSKINYGTFNQAIQKIFIKHGDTRKHIKNLFKNKNRMDEQESEESDAQIDQKAIKNTVLLIDEIDKFISKDFYGNTYHACTIFTNEDIRSVIDFIYENSYKNSDQIFQLLKNTNAYQEIKKSYKDIIDKIDIQFLKMTRNVKTFNNQQYVVQGRKIGYKESDGLDFKSVKGYQTLFQHILHFRNKGIDQQTLNEHYGISLNCGKYSYAELIHLFPKIFGVSGTLSSLNQFQQQRLEKYNINLITYTPSIYGQSKNHSEPILIQQNYANHFLAISRQIKQYHQKKTACLIFFEDQKILQEFYKCKLIDEFRQRINKITQTTQPQNRDLLIKKSTKQCSITLLTRPFGRGYDFKTFDPVVKQIGVYVIQTFLSQQQSQQIQIKGRCGRQGNRGVYQLILNGSQLQRKYKITPKMISEARQTKGIQLIDLFKKQRQEYRKGINIKIQQQVVRIKKYHDQSMQKRKFILSGQINRTDNFFYDEIVILNQNIHYIITIDDSSSMKEYRWKKLNIALKDTLNTIKNITDSQKYIKITILKFSSTCQIYQQNKTPTQINLQIIPRYNGTNFSHAFAVAYQIMTKYVQNSLIRFVFMTDGQDKYPSTQIDLIKTLRQANPGKIQYFGIQFQASGQVMKTISKQLQGSNVVSYSVHQLIQDFRQTVVKKI